jgi:hypothetical protein
MKGLWRLDRIDAFTSGLPGDTAGRHRFSWQWCVASLARALSLARSPSIRGLSQGLFLIHSKICFMFFGACRLPLHRGSSPRSSSYRPRACASTAVAPASCASCRPRSDTFRTPTVRRLLKCNPQRKFSVDSFVWCQTIRCFFRATGSSSLQQGNTKVVVSVFGPHEVQLVASAAQREEKAGFR